VSTPHNDMQEHDPDLSNLYRKAGDIAPPTSLDQAVLTTAHRAARQRRQRWMLPLSTAAVLMLGITVLLKLNSEWQFNSEQEGTIPTEQSDSLPEDLAVPSTTMAPQKRARDERLMDKAPKKMLRQQPAPLHPEAKALKKPPTASAVTDNTDAFIFSDEALSASDSGAQENDNKKETSTVATPVPEQEVLQAKPWIEKIRELVESKHKDEARKELESFRKHYPDYKLPDDLKSL